MTDPLLPQIKICGLTAPDQAERCVALGADAIGCVFFPKSPRHVTRSRAAEICAAVAGRAGRVGVFVNENFQTILDTAAFCNLSAVQLHGAESPELVAGLEQAGVFVIKTLFAKKDPSVRTPPACPAGAFLVECGGGVLPGGNARAWDWGGVLDFGRDHPLILAGGLAPDNVAEALEAADPDAVDVSSGVEASPGRKDMSRVEAFIAAVRRHKRNTKNNRPLRRIL